MPKIVEAFFGQMTNATSSRTNMPYKDWRCAFLNWPGLIVICESTHKYPGKQFVTLFPQEDSVFSQPKFTTSICLDVQGDDTTFSIKTKRSAYLFEKGLFDLTPAQRLNLIVNVLGRDAWDTYRVKGDSSYVILP